MKQQIKTKILDALFRLYYPICMRIEKAKAVRKWQKGVKCAKDMYHEIGAPRVYLFYDAKHNLWVPMTYEDNRKFKPALRRLRIMGKLRGSNLPASVEDMKYKCFYFTASKWGAKAVENVPGLKEQKLRMWIDYYLCQLSEPVMKCRSYLQGYRSRHPRHSANG